MLVLQGLYKAWQERNTGRFPAVEMLPGGACQLHKAVWWGGVVSGVGTMGANGGPQMHPNPAQGQVSLADTVSSQDTGLR